MGLTEVERLDRSGLHLVFGKDSTVPLALTNAVIDSTDLPTYLFDKAYTLVQPINTDHKMQ